MTEALLQQQVIDLARWAGYMHMHIRDSRKSAGAGFPDLVLLHTRTGRLLFVELKSQTGRMRPEQEVWLSRLALRHDVYVWRPSDWASGEIRRVLLQATEAAA